MVGKSKLHGRVAELGGPPRSVSDVGEHARTGPVQNRAQPELARRRANRKSSIRSGRTIGEQRERLETANERAAARKKDKKKAARRVVFTVVGFLLLAGVLIFLGLTFLSPNDEPTITTEPTESIPEYQPTITIVDDDASATSGKITSRMTTFIGQLERDFRDLGYTPTKAVIPSGAIREVDFYLDGYTGYVKTTIDRGSAVSAEDADRLIRYLAGQGTADFQYLDVRLPGRAYWK